MITIKTYSTMAGANYIEDPELAFTRVIEVKREGIQHDLFFAGSTTGRTYIYDSPNGRVSFPVAFNDGEKVYIMYLKTSPVAGPPVGVCVPVAIGAGNLPNGVVGVPYSASIPLSGSEPFQITDILAQAGWVNLSIVGMNLVVSGTPTDVAAEILSFSITNCGGSEPIVYEYEIYNSTPSLFITNANTPGAVIHDITGIPYVILSGSTPLEYGGLITATRGYFNGIISIGVSTVLFPTEIKLKINGPLVETIPISAGGTFDFTTREYLETDVIQIEI